MSLQEQCYEEALLTAYIKEHKNISEEFIDKGFAIVPWKEVDLLVKITSSPVDGNHPVTTVIRVVLHYPSKQYYTLYVPPRTIMNSIASDWKLSKRFLCYYCPAKQCSNRLKGIIGSYTFHNICRDLNRCDIPQKFDQIWLFYLKDYISDFINKLKGGKNEKRKRL